jgi:hypothetical protein
LCSIAAAAAMLFEQRLTSKMYITSFPSVMTVAK